MLVMLGVIRDESQDDGYQSYCHEHVREGFSFTCEFKFHRNVLYCSLLLSYCACSSETSSVVSAAATTFPFSSKAGISPPF